MGATPSALFPSVLSAEAEPHLGRVGQVLHVERLSDDNITGFYPLVRRMLDLIGNGICGLGRPQDGTKPWLKEWYESVDEWVEVNGVYLPVPLEKSEELAVCGYLNRESADHTDAPNNMPVGLSIGVYGVRELVGVALESPEECADLLDHLSATGKRLKDYEEINGQPVERVTQRPWDVVHIATFATVHSGSHSPEGQEGSDALAVGYNGTVIPGHEELARRHIEAIYSKGAMGRLQEEGAEVAQSSAYGIVG